MSKPAMLLCLMTVSLIAQWPGHPGPGLPRTPAGKPDLSAPAPRKPDGKADLSGMWMSSPEDLKFIQNLATGFKAGEFPIQPWAEAVTTQRRTDAGKSESPPARCLPQGIPILDASGAAGFPLKIVQESELIVILYEAMGQFRQVFLDDRVLPKDPNPTWLGYSIGRWDGDSLVVDSTGFNGKTWLDVEGHPTTNALHITERFQRRDYGHLNVQLTIDDPKAYTRPWTVSLSWEISPESELLEYVCNENEKDLKHLKQ